MTRTEVIRKIYKEIDNLPPIPENVAKIQALINDPRSEIGAISTHVKSDLGLTANILRVANSPWYMPISRVNTIERAISMIGLRRLYSIVLAIGAKKVLSERLVSVREAWKHSYKCAYFSQNLIKQVNASAEEVEMSYIAGLLHDMGKVVFLSLSPDLIKKITDLSEAKHVSVQEIEKAALGLDHSEVGGKVASKWKFPSQLVDAITYHHNPDQARAKSVPLVYTVYLANIFCKQAEASGDLMKEIDPSVLAFFKIGSENQFVAFMKTLIESYSIAPDVQYI